MSEGVTAVGPNGLPGYSVLMVALVPMTFGEKVRQFELSRRRHAGEMAAADGLEAEEADRRVDDLIERLLPEGFETHGHNFMWIVADNDQERVGWTWVGPELDDSGAYYIWDIEIDEAVRGAGLGGSALDQIEILIGELGAKRLALHVFEANAAARRLYESKGFVVTNIEPGHIDMSKELAGCLTQAKWSLDPGCSPAVPHFDG